MARQPFTSSNTQDEYDPKQLFTREGKRKYLDEKELDEFIVQASKQHRLCGQDAFFMIYG